MDPPIQTLLLDLSKTEKRVRFLAPCGSRIVKFLTHDWFVRWTTNTEGKECSSILSSRLWGEAILGLNSKFDFGQDQSLC